MTDDTKPRTVTVLEDLRDINRANDILRNQIRVAKEARGRTEKWIIPIEAEARVAISKMRDEEGKKLYSNDSSRDAAVESLLAIGDDAHHRTSHRAAYSECKQSSGRCNRRHLKV